MIYYVRSYANSKTKKTSIRDRTAPTPHLFRDCPTIRNSPNIVQVEERTGEICIWCQQRDKNGRRDA